MADRDDLWAVGAKGVASAALGASIQAIATPGVLYGIDGWTAETGPVYVGVFDSAAAVANANPPLVWPKHIIEVATAGNFSLELPPTAENFKNGIWVAVSSTAFPNFTISTNADTHFNVRCGPLFGSGQP